jgi:hypothetical protein
MAQKSKFLGFFRNNARNVLHIEIHWAERNYGRKNILDALEWLENSKNTRKINGIELRRWF